MYSDGTAAVRCKAHARGEPDPKPADAPTVKPRLSVRMLAAAAGYSDGSVRGLLRGFAAEVEKLEIAAGVTTP